MKIKNSIKNHKFGYKLCNNFQIFNFLKLVSIGLVVLYIINHPIVLSSQEGL